MNFTQQLLSELFKKARNFQTVKVSNISQGNSININLGYGSVRAQALTNLGEGDAIAFQTDQGNWYVIGSGNNITSGVTNTRQIIYRAVRPKRKLVYPVKTLYIIYKNSNPGLQVYLGGDDISKKIHEESGYFYGIIGYLNRISLEGYLSFDGRDTISQLDFVDWYDIYIKINNNPLVYIERWYSDWNPTFNLGMGTLEYTDDLLLNPPKRIIKKDQEVQINYDLIKFEYPNGNNNDPDFADLQGKHGFNFAYVKGTMETPRKNGTVSTCNLDTLWNITYDNYDMGISIAYRENYSYTEEYNSLYSPELDYYLRTYLIRHKTETLYTQQITDNGTNLTITITKRTIIHGDIQLVGGIGFPSTPIEVLLQNPEVLQSDITTTENSTIDLVIPKTRLEDGLNANVGQYNRGFMGYPVGEIFFVGQRGGEPWTNIELPELDTGKGMRVYRQGYLGKKYYVDYLTGVGAITWDAEKTTYTRPLVYNNTPIGNPQLGSRTTLEMSPMNTTYKSLAIVPYKKNQEVRYRVSGTATVMNTTDGEIYQQYQGDLVVWNNDDVRFDNSYQVRYRYNLESLQSFQEQINIIKLEYSTKDIILNTNDFGVINLKGGNGTTDVVVSPITMNSESFTIALSNKIKFTKFFNILSVADAQVGTFKEFDPTSFHGDFLMGYEINNKEVLIKGTIEDLPVYNDGSPFVLECTITSIKSTPTSFKNYLIMDNGSFYNYYFRKDIPLKKLGKNSINEDMPLPSGYSDDVDFNMIVNKSILPTIPLNGTFHSLFFSSNSIGNIYYSYLENLAYMATINNQFDNIKGNKIYSVVKVENSTAWVEQWDIKDNGDVKYKEVFEVDYEDIKKPNTDNGEQLAILSHKYYPPN